MAGDVKSENGVLAGQLLIFGPILRFGQALWFLDVRNVRAAEKKSVLANTPLQFRFLPVAHGAFDRRPKPRARCVERIHGAGFYQTLQNAAVQKLGIDSRAKIVNVAESSAGRARFADSLGG